MGVPTFFRWVSEKYPKIVQRCVEEEPSTFADGSEMPVDATQPNPNGMEFDNLYLDMNGIIHPCTHPEDGNEPPTMELMFKAIGKHIERLFRLVRPRKLLYMAIDGIAPRAKMNQQRSRRFRAALEADEARSDREKVIKSMKAKGLRIPSKDEAKGGFDSNVITPGTEFMDRLAEYLRAFIIERQACDEAWGQCKVILSDAQSPGEGEHKIMQFVRRQRAEKGHDANTHHVMYGLDADLIMLGLASHEVKFTVLRDVVFFGKQNRKAGAKTDQVLQASAGAAPAEPSSNEEPLGRLSISKLKPIEMLHVWILREYLQHEFRPETFEVALPFPYDFERCIDDFVFLCFFVGNDFLPHLPSLSIREGGIELLLNCYRKVLPTLTGFLTEDGDLNLGRVGELMKVLGAVEDRIFQLRRAQEEREKQRRKAQEGRKAATASNHHHNNNNNGEESELRTRYSDNPLKNAARTRTVDQFDSAPDVDPSMLISLSANKKPRVEPEPEPEKKPAPSAAENKSVAAALRAQLNGVAKKPAVESKPVQVEEEEEEEELAPEIKGAATPEGEVKEEDSAEADTEALEAQIEEDDEFDPSVGYEERIKVLQSRRNEVPEDDIVDDIRFGETGWKERYYETKFGKDFASDPAKRRQVVESYVRGLCWVLQYYYKGCQSWKWYYEFHYAPFASDLVDLESISLEWAPSRPFKPFEQLMAVLPPQSAHALPEPCRWYMTDSDSEIADFYPREIQFDPNGKPVRWLWVALLPFIDESRLLEVTKSLEAKFNLDDKRRNAMMPDLIFVPRNATGASLIQGVLGKSPPNLLPNWESDQIAVLKRKNAEEKSKLFGEALNLPAPTTAGDARGGGTDDIYLSAPEAGGISGFFLPAAPEFAVQPGMRVKSPFPSVLDSIESSASFVCEFRLPPMLPHLSRLCEGVTPPPPVLNEQDLQIRRPKLSALDVSVLVMSGAGNQYSQGAFSASDRTWGSAEPERKFNYFNQQVNPLLGGAPPPLLPGLTSRSGPPDDATGAASSSLLSQLQQTLRQYQHQSGYMGGQPQYAYPAPPAYPQQQQQQQQQYGVAYGSYAGAPSVNYGYVAGGGGAAQGSGYGYGSYAGGYDQGYYYGGQHAPQQGYPPPPQQQQQQQYGSSGARYAQGAHQSSQQQQPYGGGGGYQQQQSRQGGRGGSDRRY